MAAATTLTTNPLLFKKLSYKPADFTDVVLVGTVPFTLVVHPSVPAHDPKGFDTYAKAKPGLLTFSTVGQGASSHPVGEMFKAATQTSLRDIPCKGAAPALTAVFSGEVGATFDGITNYLPFARSGKREILAVFSERRVSAAETVPTMVESGYPEAVAYSWFGVVASAGTPAAIVDRLNHAINASLQAPEPRVDASSGPIRSPEGYGEFMRRQAQIWEKVSAPQARAHAVRTKARATRAAASDHLGIVCVRRAAPSHSTCWVRSSSTCFASRERRSSRIAAVSAPRPALGW
jgi:tripartite-type tricarboxylate transporter receptor subunit TctC